jgi:hypothetical protein
MRRIKLSLVYTSRYREMDCIYCKRSIHTANGWLPSFVSECIGKALFRIHRRTAEHKGNRPPRPWCGGKLAPAPRIDTEAFQRRQNLT